MASFIYNSFKQFMADGSINLDQDTFKIALMKGTHSPVATSTQWSNVSADEVDDGDGYVAGGQTLANVSWSRDGGVVTFDANDPVWTSATFEAAYGIIYSDTSTNNLLVGLIDFDGTKSVSNGTFTVHWHADGIFTLS